MAASMSSGSEAIDLAIKIGRKWGYNVKGIPPDQAKILTVTGNYHGKILGSLSGSSNEDIKDGRNRIRSLGIPIGRPWSNLVSLKFWSLFAKCGAICGWLSSSI